MQTHTILIALGAVLLLAGVIGGGLTLKEIKLPSLDRISRVLAVVVGAAFIVIGVYLERESRQPPEDAPVAKQESEDAQRAELERKEAELAQQQREAARQAQLEKERLEKERLEKERLEKARLEKARLAKEQAEKARLEKERLAKAKAEEAEKARLAAEAEQRAKAQADFTRRALLAPKSNAWAGAFRVHDPKTGTRLLKGKLAFGPTTYGERIAYARLRIDESSLRQLPVGPAEATEAVWGFMGGSTDSAISIVFGKAPDTPIVVFNKLAKDSVNGYLELRGVLMMTRGGKNQVVAHTSASCRAR